MAAQTLADEDCSQASAAQSACLAGCVQLIIFKLVNPGERCEDAALA